jgi:hypothetical protein
MQLPELYFLFNKVWSPPLHLLSLFSFLAVNNSFIVCYSLVVNYLVRKTSEDNSLYSWDTH